MMKLDRYLNYFGAIVLCFSAIYIGGHVVVAWLK